MCAVAGEEIWWLPFNIKIGCSIILFFESVDTCSIKIAAEWSRDLTLWGDFYNNTIVMQKSTRSGIRNGSVGQYVSWPAESCCWPFLFIVLIYRAPLYAYWSLNLIWTEGIEYRLTGPYCYRKLPVIISNRTTDKSKKSKMNCWNFKSL